MPVSLEECRCCVKLQQQFRQLRLEYPNYWNKPVPASGNHNSPLMIVGLAPGRHGANRTGIPFTGDASGDLLFQTLEKLSLVDQVIITNAVKCLPVKNKPGNREITNCQRYLIPEINRHKEKPNAVFLALGRIAHNAILKALALTLANYPFGHGRYYLLSGASLVDSYHCSRYNTQTGRLTADMLENAVSRAAQLAGLSHERIPDSHPANGRFPDSSNSRSINPEQGDASVGI